MEITMASIHMHTFFRFEKHAIMGIAHFLYFHRWIDSRLYPLIRYGLIWSVVFLLPIKSILVRIYATAFVSCH